MATISKPIVIPKHRLKVMFNIDVDVHSNVNISGTRFVEVAHKEDFNLNVKLCKNEHLQVGTKFVNSNELYHKLLNHLKEYLSGLLKEELPAEKIRYNSKAKPDHPSFP